MQTIVKGKTEGEHRAEEKALITSGKLPTPVFAKWTKRLPKKDAEEMKTALRELEEKKGDFAVDH